MRINLSKDNFSADLRKGATITARMFWPSSTDYDLGAEVLYADGHSESIAMFGAGKKLIGGYLTPMAQQTRDGKVRHRGDIQRGDGSIAEEIIDIDLTDDILAVVPWGYSSQGNGTGSFFRYRVTLEVTDGANTIRVPTENALDDPRVYTCVPGVITNLPSAGPHIVHQELYTPRNNENRPRVTGTSAGFVIDVAGGHKNEYKR